MILAIYIILAISVFLDIKITKIGIHVFPIILIILFYLLTKTF